MLKSAGRLTSSGRQERDAEVEKKFGLKRDGRPKRSLDSRRTPCSFLWRDHLITGILLDPMGST